MSMRSCLGLAVLLSMLIGFAGAEDSATPLSGLSAVANDGRQEDFPDVCVDTDGTPWVVYIDHDIKAINDGLRIARGTDDGLKVVGELSERGLIYQPAVACDGEGTVWAVWSQLDEDLRWSLLARGVRDGKITEKTIALEDSSGSVVFADAATDPVGRVWVTWQSFRDRMGDIFTTYYDPKTKQWADPIQVTSHASGDWEPRLAFVDDGAAWIAFDSSRDGVFNVHLARVTPEGKVTLHRASNSPRYQGRASIVATADGKGFWLTWENGKQRWGKNSRGVGGTAGLNSEKRVEVVRFDVATGRTTTLPDPTSLLRALGTGEPRPAPRAPARPKRPAAGVQALNLPKVFVNAAGDVCLTCRAYRGTHWKIALLRYDTGAKTWSDPVVLPNSSFTQDRHLQSASDAKGNVWLAWPSDLRTTKRAGFSGVYLASLDADASLPPSKRELKPTPPLVEQVARWGEDTPERARDDRNTWTVDGKELTLYWGDFHRHTDISNCRTAHDGCILEQFRYALDVGVLDMLGTSDHTDVGKPYDPYEWWVNQKLADVFYIPDLFTSFYVYEREQRWPWGHRNVIFARRGGPLVYINRALYQSMPYHAYLPIGDGPNEISPQELWAVLRKVDNPKTIISHTGATGMGTSWDGYDEIDNVVENLVEIYQGARVSYEGIQAPQPLVGFPKSKQLKADAHGSVKTGQDFGKYNQGVYQNALRNGYKLGVFANSDHISTHTSFGGVYAESMDREGLIRALESRRTIGATDKIFMEFSCNGHLLGEIFETTDKPELTIRVRGTAPLRRVTVVRNEADFRRFEGKDDSAELDVTFTDEEPLPGENRYYVRVEQIDGNMGWTSPVWVTFK